MYLLLDLETTGLDPDRDCILEIGAIILDKDLQEIDRKEFVCGCAFTEPGAWIDQVVLSARSWRCKCLGR
jgi:oligoribonuclease (3'-5' exoribonuclease)